MLRISETDFFLVFSMQQKREGVKESFMEEILNRIQRDHKSKLRAGTSCDLQRVRAEQILLKQNSGHQKFFQISRGFNTEQIPVQRAMSIHLQGIWRLPGMASAQDGIRSCPVSFARHLHRMLSRWKRCQRQSLAVPQWTRRGTSNQEIPGSNPTKMGYPDTVSVRAEA